MKSFFSFVIFVCMLDLFRRISTVQYRCLQPFIAFIPSILGFRKGWVLGVSHIATTPVWAGIIKRDTVFTEF